MISDKSIDNAALDRETAAQAMRSVDKRIVAHLAKGGSTDRGPDLMMLSPSEYADPARAERELQLLFRKSPLVLCLSCDIANPGDCFLFDELGVSIVVTRAKDGKVNGFLNMCMHRGARLVSECESRSRLVCPFHAWTYDLKGQLVGLPDQVSFAGLDRSSRALMRVPVAEAHGVIFIVPDTNADAVSIDQFLGPFGVALNHMDLTTAAHIKTDRVETNANWKYVLNTYGEAYHFTALHPQTFALLAHNNVLAYTEFGQHYRVNFSLKTYDDYLAKEEAQWPQTLYGGSHLAFPNTIINSDERLGGDRFAMTFRIYPRGVDRCVTYFSTYRIGNSNVDDAEYLAIHDTTVKVVTTEDYSVSEGGQRNLRQSPAKFQMVLGRNEVALQQFHRNVARVIGL
jgi:phenylpropionate dioxygenase-like ring-hydroxylating dioxygenase large terminal subunit